MSVVRVLELLEEGGERRKKETITTTKNNNNREFNSMVGFGGSFNSWGVFDGWMGR